MFSALHSPLTQRGWALSAHKACALSGALIRAGGVLGAFMTVAKTAFTLGVDSPGARTTKGKAMFHAASASLVPSRALALQFPAPLQAREGKHIGVSEGSESYASMRIIRTPGLGSSPRALQAGNSSRIKCVASEAGSY